MNTENCCIPCRQWLLGQTIKQPLSNVEPQEHGKHEHFAGWGKRKSCNKIFDLCLTLTKVNTALYDKVNWSYSKIETKNNNLYGGGRNN